MSTSFYVHNPAVPAIPELVRAIDRPGLAWADGDLGTLGVMQHDESLLLYIPGVSSRGVEVSRKEDEYRVRILALSTRGDYDLALRIAEVIGAYTLVDVEGGGTVPASALRAYCNDEWMVRDMAFGLTAVRSSLAAGQTVTVFGPLVGLDILPTTTSDPITWPDALCRAQLAAARDRGVADASSSPMSVLAGLLKGAAEYRTALLDAEREARRARERPLRGGVIVALLTLVLAWFARVVGAALRIALLPLRSWLRARIAACRGARMSTLAVDLCIFTDLIRDEPQNPRWLHERARLIARLGWWSIADRELEAALRALARAPESGITPARVHRDLARIRVREDLPYLAGRSRREAFDAGYSRVRWFCESAASIVSTAFRGFLRTVLVTAKLADKEAE